MKKDLNVALEAVRHHERMILDAERYIWNNPESGYREWKTHAYMKKIFEDLGHTVVEAGNIPGFYADVVTGREGPTVAVFGEMDSLIVPTHPEADPETGAVHACGHHCQCAALLGLAAALADPAVLEGLCGTIRLIAVPAEELIEVAFRRELQKNGTIRYMGGKQEFMYRGILDGVDLSLMIHTTGGEGKYQCNGGSNGCIIKEAVFTGKSAHAGGSPHKGINALYAANCAMQASNALRETFREKDYIRFHPIITAGGSAVNSIPDHVSTESYVRGATMEAIYEANRKLNRAFAGSAAAMGCGLHLWDQHGYAPRTYDPALKALCLEVGQELFPAEEISFTSNWGTGCSDMGDVCCVMPAIHPYVTGATGASHSSEFYITDPVTACVTSAQVQAAILIRLLENGAERAGAILQNPWREYPTIPEHLAMIDRSCIDQDAVSYEADGAITLRYC